MLGKNLIKAAAAKAQPLYIEDVMSTWLYTGNDSTQTITNGIDLAGEGGMVWIKGRSAASNNILFDTAQGSGYWLITNKIDASLALSSIFSFNATGFSLLTSSQANTIPVTYASWTFRKAPKFFDVVTYTGTGGPRTVAHNLGSVPGCIIVKRTDTTGDWQVYHRSLANTEYMVLNSTAAKATGATRWNSTTPTSTVFSLGTDAAVNASGATYVAYLFAHDAGGFGDDGTESVIKCGSFSHTYNIATAVDLGWEPQWVLVKSSSYTNNWVIYDTMRGMPVSGNRAQLYADSSFAEGSVAPPAGIYPTATGFIADSQGVNTGTHIYIAIRRGPMKTPTSGAEVFDADTYSSTGSITTGFPVDLILARSRASVSDCFAGARITGNNVNLQTTSTATEGLATNGWNFASNTSIEQQYSVSGVAWNFRRAPGFFDVVAYTGTGVARTVPHNLGVAPELMIVKGRNVLSNWSVYHSAAGATQALLVNDPMPAFLNSDRWNNVAPNGDSFTIGTNGDINASSFAYIAYLFATLPGVSKVGSYTGTGTTLQIDCGFASGSRLVLIKRTDSTGSWYIWDTARGITSSSDPYLLLNSTAAEVTGTDYIDPYSAGFEISSSAPAEINTLGGSYIFLAIS